MPKGGIEMKRKNVLVGILVLEAICCYVWCAASLAAPAWFSTVFAFPFEQIGRVLRAMSLSGMAGNVVAWILYAVLCLAPVIYVVWRIGRKRARIGETGDTGETDGAVETSISFKQWFRARGEELLLLVLGVVLGFVLYAMINPAVIPGWLGAWLGAGEAGIRMGKSLLGGLVYSILVAYLVLRLLRRVRTADSATLWPCLWWLLAILAVCCVFMAVGANTIKLANSVRDLYASNTGAYKGLELTLFFLAGQYTVECLPYVLGIQIAFAGMKLVEALRQDLYSETAVAAADRLSYLCGRMLVVTVLSHSIFYLLQMVFASRLRLIHGQVVIPLFTIGVVLAVLLLLQLLRRGRQLQKDNEMFI